MEKPSFDFFPYSTERRSKRREPNPDPVPPPKEWKMRNPCRKLGDTKSRVLRSIWHLEAGTLVRHPPDPVHGHLDLLLPDGVVAAGIVVGSVLLPSDQLLRVEQLTIRSSPDLHHRDGSRYKLGMCVSPHPPQSARGLQRLPWARASRILSWRRRWRRSHQRPPPGIPDHSQ